MNVLQLLLPDVPALCFLRGLAPFHAGAVPRGGSVRKRQALGRGNRVRWEWQSPWAQLGCLSCLYGAASALYEL